jgi:hypothetical protein
MKGSRSKADDFLEAMIPAEPAALVEESERPPARAKARPKEAPVKSRAGLKHFGAYLDEGTLEKIAVLRVRLKKDNSELTKLAIDELHAKHLARRAHGDS